MKFICDSCAKEESNNELISNYELQEIINKQLKPYKIVEDKGPDEESEIGLPIYNDYCNQQSGGGELSLDDTYDLIPFGLNIRINESNMLDPKTLESKFLTSGSIHAYLISDIKFKRLGREGITRDQFSSESKLRQFLSRGKYVKDRIRDFDIKYSKFSENFDNKKQELETIKTNKEKFNNAIANFDNDVRNKQEELKSINDDIDKSVAESNNSTISPERRNELEMDINALKIKEGELKNSIQKLEKERTDLEKRLATEESKYKIAENEFNKMNDGSKIYYVQPDEIRLLDNNELKITKGSKVEAKYRGKYKYYKDNQKEWFKGEVADVNNDGTYNVVFDNGGKINMLSEKDDILYRMDAKKDAYIDKNIAFVLDTIFEKGFKFQVDGKDFVLAGTSWNGKYEPKQVIGTTMKIFKVGVELTILEGTELGIVGKTDASCLSRRKKIYNMFNTLLGYAQGTLKNFDDYDLFAQFQPAQKKTTTTIKYNKKGGNIIDEN